MEFGCPVLTGDRAESQSGLKIGQCEVACLVPTVADSYETGKSQNELPTDEQAQLSGQEIKWLLALPFTNKILRSSIAFPSFWSAFSTPRSC